MAKVELNSNGIIANLAECIGKWGGKHGLIVKSEPLLNFSPVQKFFLNSTYGINMARDTTSAAIGTIIHAGVNSGSAESGTTDGATTANKLIQSGQNFVTTVGVGASVHNTTDDTYAIVTVVDSNTQLTLDTDIMATGETYTINDIWVGRAVQGPWNFADAGTISITNGTNNDEAVFENATGRTYQMSNYASVTGSINLDEFSDITETIQLSFRLNGVQVGLVVDLDDFIDPNDLDLQQFSIPTSAFGLSSGVVNELRILLVRTGGGAKPDFSLDNITLSPAIPIIFTAKPDNGTRYHAYALRVVLIDAYTGIATVAGATENATAPLLSYNKLLGVSSLTNGIVFEGSIHGTNRPSQTIRQLSDLMLAGMEIIDFVADGTNAMLILETKFHQPMILDDITGDNLTLTISDDLSGLVQFSASLRGAVEVNL
jgi:hypothetical protein